MKEIEFLRMMLFQMRDVEMFCNSEATQKKVLTTDCKFAKCMFDEG